jgi:archaellum component FlaC
LSAGSSTDHKPSQFDANTPADIVHEQIAELRKTAEDTKRTLQTLRTDLNEIVPQMQDAIGDLKRQVKRLEEKIAFLEEKDSRQHRRVMEDLEERVGNIVGDAEKVNATDLSPRPPGH